MKDKIIEIDMDIAGLKQILASSDYKALKHADGVLTDAEYEETRQERQRLRDGINALEQEKEQLERGAGDEPD